ncbi:MAG: GreA/GreB family elongation factor [Terrimicrobiaceae bacterium]|nr:GreA/GreB family elongation factor [Terrimicrobiaceae bacterium]
MNEELQKVVEAGKITPAIAASLEHLQPGAYCIHKSWGFGQVAEWNLLTGQILIDFGSKKKHPMQLEYAAQTLTAIPADHVRAQSASNPDAVLARASEDPAGLVRDVLRDHGGRATPDQIAAVFVPHAMDAAAFKKFFDGAKRKLKGDGHVHLPGKKGEPIELHDAPVNQGAKLIENFRGARHPKDQVLALDSIVKALDDFAKEIEEMQSLAAQVEDAAKKGQRLHSVQAVEMLLARDEICERHDALQPGADAPTVADVLRGEQSRLAELFASLPASKHRRVLSHFKAAYDERWQERALALALKGTPRLAQEIARLFEQEGEKAAFAAAIDKWLRERTISPEVLLWLCKERGAGYPEFFNIGLFGAVIAALEDDVLLSEITRGTKLHDLVMDDKTLIADLLAGADPVVVRDAVRKLKLTTVFDDLNKRSLLARIIKLHPGVQTMITGEQEESRSASLVVSWASLDRRREEYEDLINRQIPQNTRDISIARDYGDLRENFEFKSAKEQQRVLLRRRSEMERELELARGTNFEDVDTSRVSIGSSVVLSDPATGAVEEYHILGAWDGAPERNIVSYQAGIGQALIGRAAGESVQVPTEHGDRTLRIERIDAFKNLELLRSAEQAPA